MDKDKLIATVVVVLLFIAFDANSAHLKIGKVDDHKEASIWMKLERLSEAEELIAEGEIKEAKIVLDSLMEQYPDYAEARELHKSLSREVEPEENESVDAGREKMDRVSELWVEFLKLKEKGEVAAAREMLIAVDDLCGTEDVKPPFLADLDRERAGIEKKAAELLKDQLDGIGTGFADAAVIENSEERIKVLIKLYDKLNSILLKYRDFEVAVSLMDGVMAEIEKASRVVMARAETLKRLEGCSTATSIFQKLIDILAHPEFELYQSAKKEVLSCEG